MRTAKARMLVGILAAIGLAAVVGAASLIISRPWPASATRQPEAHASSAQAASQLIPDPIAAAKAAVRPDPSATRSTRLLSLGPGTARVEVVDDGLPDDSVGAIRHQLELRLEAGAWRAKGDTVAYRCRPGRGTPLAAPDGWQAGLCL